MIFEILTGLADHSAFDRSRARSRWASALFLAVTLFHGLAKADEAPPVPRILETRQRPGGQPIPSEFPPFIYESVPDIMSSASEFVAVPDRWRQFYAGKWYDPYNQNVLKGDIPVFGAPGHEWFFELSLISDSLLEGRRIPVPVGGPSTEHGNTNDTFGDGKQFIFAENLIASFALIRGNTTFKPPELELRAVPVFNVNHVEGDETGVLAVDPATGSRRDDSQIGFQELFADIHLTNLSDRYDFISSRIGIQRFISDFRGFVYSTDEPGVRLFGNYDNNHYQYNLAWFSRLNKDTNSGLNTTFEDRHEDVVIANLFRQDLIALGHTVGASVLYRADTAGSEGNYFDDNGFLVRPSALGDERAKNIYSTYFGLFSDGHIDRVNTTNAFYFVTGSESHNQIAGQNTEIQAAMLALEVSYDVDWVRFRSSFFYATGDDDPYDGKAKGFDAIFDLPNFAGGDLSYWQRENLPFIGGGGVNLVNRGSFLPNLRPGKEEGQSNFVNPGLLLYNLGVDFELTPKLKLITNMSFLQFDDVAVLEALRQDGSFSRNIGYDLSAGFLYRPFLNNNVQWRMGTAVLIPDSSLEGLFGDDRLYDLFTNVILQY